MKSVVHMGRYAGHGLIFVDCLGEGGVQNLDARRFYQPCGYSNGMALVGLAQGTIGWA
jgi:hypothetical protein